MRIWVMSSKPQTSVFSELAIFSGTWVCVGLWSQRAVMQVTSGVAGELGAVNQPLVWLMA